jgi:hypothetical protein
MSLIDVLNEALQGGTDKHVFLLRLQPFPSEPEHSFHSQGWPYQLIAPILGMYKVRESSQIDNADKMLSLLQDKYPQQIETARVVYARDDSNVTRRNTPPLSWHLTKSDIQDIETC